LQLIFLESRPNDCEREVRYYISRSGEPEISLLPSSTSLIHSLISLKSTMTKRTAVDTRSKIQYVNSHIEIKVQ